jgi:3-oxoacyl-[acyl-carrier protein] reductase
MSTSNSLQSQESTTESSGEHMRKRFSNQVVIVTGGSKGIGRGISKLFAQEGAKVVLVGRDEGQLQAVESSIRANGGKAIHIQADVSNPNAMERMFEKTMDCYGRIDVLCHNAGIYPLARLEHMTLEEWQRVIDVNLTGTFLAVKGCIPVMKSQGHGKIVITSSISGPRTALPGYSHYTASKGGVAGFIRTAAVELAKYHININSVEPGNIISEGFDALGSDHYNNMIRAIPLGRLGTPDDVANAILFLASKEASYMTGQSLIIDGGQTLPESHFLEY